MIIINLEVIPGIPLPGGGGLRNYYEHESHGRYDKGSHRGYEDYEDHQHCKQHNSHIKHLESGNFKQFGTHNREDFSENSNINKYNNGNYGNEYFKQYTPSNEENNTKGDDRRLANNPITETTEKPKIDVRSGI